MVWIECHIAGSSTDFVSSNSVIFFTYLYKRVCTNFSRIFKSLREILKSSYVGAASFLPICHYEDHLNIYFKTVLKDISYFWINSFFFFLTEEFRHI